MPLGVGEPQLREWLMDTVESRKTEFIEELEKIASKHAKHSHINETLVQSLFYGSLIFGGLAVVSGLIKIITVPPEIISLFAGLATGATTLAKTANYRAVADWNFAVRDTAYQFIEKLKYEIPMPVTQEGITAISEEWRRRRTQLERYPNGLNRLGDSRIS